jgi:phosphoglycerate dehydrogenase-like enzyme
MPTILLNLPTDAVDPVQVAEMESIMHGYKVLVTQDRALIQASLDQVEIAAGGPLGELLERMPHLRWYQQWAAGADWLARYPGAVVADFVLTTASGVHAVPISEHVVALMLAWVRRLNEAVLRQAQREWQAPTGESLGELYESTLLVVGAGAIGERVARLGDALGMRVLAIRHNPDRPVAGAAVVYGPERLLEALPQADFVVLAAPLTAATRGMIGPAELGVMKRSAFLVNIGRGGLIQQDALVRALAEGQIGGAGLDVFDPEPLPADSPLWAMPNVIITAHYSGATPCYHKRAMVIFLDNLRRYRDRQPLRNQVDKPVGY